MNTTTCFAPAHILLPAEQIPLKQWGCIACDQFTSDREYWQRAKEAADGSPSTLNLILPEVYLEDGDADARVEQIHATMADYAQNVLTRAVDGFVYVERTEQSGRVRQGLVGKVDLEAYSYQRGAKCTVRPSESTVESRIPPRMKVRTGATLETPHIMMLADDPQCTLIEPIAARKNELRKVYEGELMLGGGHVAGWAVEDPAMIDQIETALAALGSQEAFDAKYPDAARHSGDFGVGEGGVQEPQSVGFDHGIAVHGHAHFGTGLPDAAVQGMALAAVLFQFDGGDAASRPGGCELDPVPGVVGAAVVDRQDFKFGGGIVACEDAVECVQHRFAFVVGRDDHGAGRQFPVGERPAGTVPQAGEKHQESIIEDIDPEHSQAEQGEKPDGMERLEAFQ